MRLTDPERLPLRAREPAALVAGLVAIGLLTATYARWLFVTNSTIVALSFLLVVLIIAAGSTLRVALATSIAAFACFNYFFLPPVGTFTIADPENWAALFSLLAVSVVASHLSAQVRRRAQEALARRDELGRLFELTRDILLTTATADAVALVATSISRRFGLEAVTICLPHGDTWRLHQGGTPLELDLRDLDSAFAAARARVASDAPGRVAPEHMTAPAGRSVRSWLVPLRSGARVIGVLAGAGALEHGTRDAIAGVTAIAIERNHLLEERKEAEIVRRGAEVKSALLASLGHDLKTPLTAVTVAANNLNAAWLTGQQRCEQAAIVRTELERLNDLFENIVQMARIETDAVSAEPEWVQPAEIVEAAARQAEQALAGRTLQLDSISDPVLVRLDPRLTSAALAHVLENAGQYSPAGTPVEVRVTLVGSELQIRVRDRGAGIAPADADHLFERFYRGAIARHHRVGTGVGLAITRGLVAAEAGRVWAANHPEGGAVFTLAVPTQIRTAEPVEEEAL